MCLFHFSTCFEQPSAHHQESQLYQYIICYISLCVGGCLVCRSETCTLDGHLHRVHGQHNIKFNSRNLQNRGMIFRISSKNVTPTVHLSQLQLIIVQIGNVTRNKIIHSCFLYWAPAIWYEVL